ncbi:transmembrane protein 81 isoform X2 [Engraulis encrasicolus]|uniref:transmembrane protein 81 isoform X2 n=1 Tax=Engraulis encrasicolus TaxID=184585 RepID=UPI002FD29488
MAPFHSTFCKTNPETCANSTSGGRLHIWKWPLWVVVVVVLLSCPLCNASTSTDEEDMKTLEKESDSSVGVKHSSPCSSTCGQGIRVQEVCPLNGGDCYERKVKCLETWQCGMRTLMVPAGGSVELDCLGEVMSAMGTFSFMISWRVAPGIVTTDTSLFVRLVVPQLAQLTLDPVQEKHAGTYRCDVLDKSHRTVKRIFYGLKVLPPELLRLDFTSALEQWDKIKVPISNGSEPLDEGQPSSSALSSSHLKGPLFISLTVTLATAALLLVLYLWDVLRRPPGGSRPVRRREEYLQMENLHCKVRDEQISLGPLSIVQHYLAHNGLADAMVIAETQKDTLQESVV